MAATQLEFELEGTIYLIEKDENGNVISRDPIDSEGFLKIFAEVTPYILESDYLESILEYNE